MAHLLIVDDLPELRHLLVLALSRDGHTVESAVNGLEALERMRAAPPDLVITDIVMPEMDGIALLRRAAAEFPDVPFIAMSGGMLASSAYLELAAQHGAVACLAKPFSMADLRAKVDATLLRRFESRAAVAVAG